MLYIKFAALKDKPTLEDYNMKNFLPLTLTILLFAFGGHAQKVGQLSNIKRITSSSEKFENPRWSPDGSKIAFTQLGYNGVYVINNNGTNQKKLSSGVGEGYRYQWSIDSKNILVRDTRWLDNGNGKRRRAHAIWSLDLSGKKVRMTYDTERVQPAAWRYSADGTKSVLSPGAKVITDIRLAKVSSKIMKKSASTNSNVSFISTGDYLFILDAAGNANKVIDGTVLCPSISPNGKKIAFYQNRALYVMNIDGSNKVKIGKGFNPTWVGNSQIIFEQTKDDGHKYTAGELYIVNIDGTGLKALTATSNRIEMNPCVSADGSKIVFTSFTDGQIYIADLK